MNSTAKPSLGLMMLAVILAACGGSPTAPSDPPNLVVRLTDDHTEQVDEVNLFFTSVTAKPADGPRETTLGLALGPDNPQDLLKLQNKVITLATAVVDPGTYEFLMINLDETMSNLVVDGSPISLQIPSEKIKILGGFVVPEDGVTTVTLDFDAERSLVLLGNGDWLLTPVIAMEVGGD